MEKIKIFGNVFINTFHKNNNIIESKIINKKGDIVSFIYK